LPACVVTGHCHGEGRRLEFPLADLIGDLVGDLIGYTISANTPTIPSNPEKSFLLKGLRGHEDIYFSGKMHHFPETSTCRLNANLW